MNLRRTLLVELKHDGEFSEVILSGIPRDHRIPIELKGKYVSWPQNWPFFPLHNHSPPQTPTHKRRKKRTTHTQTPPKSPYISINPVMWIGLFCVCLCFSSFTFPPSREMGWCFKLGEALYMPLKLQHAGIHVHTSVCMPLILSRLIFFPFFNQFLLKVFYYVWGF